MVVNQITVAPGHWSHVSDKLKGNQPLMVKIANGWVFKDQCFEIEACQKRYYFLIEMLKFENTDVWYLFAQSQKIECFWFIVDSVVFFRQS